MGIANLFIFLFGLEVGSFANVCIYRWPRNTSILSPRRSHCPWCQKQIPWYDNIPILSYILLQAKCRQCQSKISLRYPLIELLVPALWLTYYISFKSAFGYLGFLAVIFYLLFTVVVTTFTDMDWKIIPNESSYSLFVVGIALSYWNPLLAMDSSRMLRPLLSLCGALTGGGSLLLVAYFGRLLFKREAMGGGDIKLLAAMGTVLGYEGVISTLIIGSIVGGTITLPLLITGRMKRHSYLPYGPFLNTGALVTLFLLLKKI